jgi:hypothetical protein
MSAETRLPLPAIVVSTSVQEGLHGIPCTSGRQSTLEDIRTVEPVFFSQHGGTSLSFIPFCKVVQSARAYDTGLEDTGRTDDDIAPCRFGKLIEGKLDSDRDLDRELRRKDEGVVYPVVHMRTTDDEFLFLRVGKMDTHDRRVELDMACACIRTEGIIIFDVPMPTFKLDGTGYFGKGIACDVDVGIDFLEAVYGRFTDGSKHGVDSFDFCSGSYSDKERFGHRQLLRVTGSLWRDPYAQTNRVI